MKKRAVPVSAASGGVQSSGIVREAASIAAVLPQPATAALGKGAGAAPDRAGECCFCVGLGVPRPPPQCIRLHVLQEPGTPIHWSAWVKV